MAVAVVNDALPPAVGSSWDYVRDLLDPWSRRPTGHVPPELGGDDERFSAWGELTHRAVDAVARERLGRSATASDLRGLSNLIPLGMDRFDAAHALAWAVDHTQWTTYVGSWKRGLGNPPTVDVASGDRFPVGEWLGPIDDNRRSVDPWKQSVREDELPHVRTWSDQVAADAEPVRLRIHFDSRGIDAAALEPTFASLHPNSSDDDFIATGTTNIFPVRVVCADQAARTVRLLDAATDRGAALVVGGEFSVTDVVIGRVQSWLDGHPEPPAVVVVGSHHLREHDARRNVALALRPGLPPLRHDKLTPFQRATGLGGPAQREAIDPQPRVLDVWTGTWVRFAILICKELLDPGLRAAARRAGVNVLGVPVYSKNMSTYPAHAGEISTATQGRVVIANNPTHRNGRQVQPTAVFGHPLEGRSSLSLASGSPGRGLGLDRLGQDPQWIEVS